MPKKKPNQKTPQKKRALPVVAIAAFTLKRRSDFSDEIQARRKKIRTKGNFFRRKTDIERCEELTDERLTEVVVSQNPMAYEILFRRYQKKLFSYIYHLVGNREEAEDILQSVFAKTFRNIQSFDASKKFSSWIYRIAHNEAVNYLKRKSKKRFVSWEDIVSTKDQLEMSNGQENPDEIWRHKEISKEVHDAIDQLPERYRQILELRYFADYSYDAIGKILGKPVNTVGTLINRAKGKLHGIMEAENR